MKQHRNLLRALWLAAGVWWLLTPRSAWSQADGFAETRDFGAALANFKLGMWAPAEQGFRDFIKTYTNAANYVPAVLFAAQAAFNQTNHDGVLKLLAEERPRAGKSADQFDYWTAAAQLARGDVELAHGNAQLAHGDYAVAAEGFARLLQEHPDSDRCDDAAYFEAEARFKLGDLPGAIRTLQSPSGAFQKIAAANPTNDFVINGLLLLGQAQLAQKDYPAAERTLLDLADKHLWPEAEWRRLCSLGQVQVAAGESETALQTSTNLLALPVKADRLTDGVFFQAEVYEHLDRLADAVTNYERLTDKDVPAERRNLAEWKIVELELRQNQLDLADGRLGRIETNSELLLLTRGELKLKRHEVALATATNNAATADVTNFLFQARTNFEGLINVFTNSPLLGQAELNLGWCLLQEGRLAESRAAFGAAAGRLPFSEDQAVARFKLADIQYQQNDFSGAASNYNALIDDYAVIPSVKNSLIEPALYQLVQASLTNNDTATAGRAMTNLLTWFANGPFLEKSMLLLGQGYIHQGEAGHARAILNGFQTSLPESPLLPEARLIIAHTYELEANWPEAIVIYEDWISRYTNHAALPRAAFALALANDKADRGTNAFKQFTNFLEQYPTNDLVPLAKWWVAAYNLQTGDYLAAETQFKGIYQSQPNSSLRYEAVLMAGRSAVKHYAYGEAMRYFTNYPALHGCPLDVLVRAQYLYGDTLIMAVDFTTGSSADTNKTSFAKARDIFTDLIEKYPTNAVTAQALGRLGDCYMQLAELEPALAASNYSNSTNYYQKLLEVEPPAEIKYRSQAACGIALALEKLGRKNSDPKLLDAAMKGYLDVMHKKNLKTIDEAPDMYWVNWAGLAAGQLAEATGDWGGARNVYIELGESLPSMKGLMLQKQRNAEEKLAAAKTPGL
jgi:TolA-binding protein